MTQESPASKYIARNTQFRSGCGYVLNLTTAQENTFAKFLSNYKSNYSVLGNSCVDAVVRGLQAAGITFDFDPFDMLGEPVLITPYDLQQGLPGTPGLVTGSVPHPQQ